MNSYKTLHFQSLVSISTSSRRRRQKNDNILWEIAPVVLFQVYLRYFEFARWWTFLPDNIQGDIDENSAYLHTALHDIEINARSVLPDSRPSFHLEPISRSILRSMEFDQLCDRVSL